MRSILDVHQSLSTCAYLKLIQITWWTNSINSVTLATEYANGIVHIHAYTCFFGVTTLLDIFRILRYFSNRSRVSHFSNPRQDWQRHFLPPEWLSWDSDFLSHSLTLPAIVACEDKTFDFQAIWRWVPSQKYEAVCLLVFYFFLFFLQYF